MSTDTDRQYKVRVSVNAEMFFNIKINLSGNPLHSHNIIRKAALKALLDRLDSGGGLQMVNLDCGQVYPVSDKNARIKEPMVINIEEATDA